MSNNGWRYYNHAMIPTCAPHEEPDLTPVHNGDIWKSTTRGRRPLLARWTTDFDCDEETNWWYVIKDTAFDIQALKAKRRYEITKGCKYFDVFHMANPADYAEELYAVQVAAFSAYPEKYRPTVNKDRFIQSVKKWKTSAVVYGGFSKQDGKLCGYAYLVREGSVLHFYVLKTDPIQEKYGLNAAIIYKILEDVKSEFKEQFYICDGARSILHETAFQNYLEKYFGFRKAYCRLHIAYNPMAKRLVLFLYHFRNLFQKLDTIGAIHSINGVLAMHKIFTEQEKKYE